MTLFGVTLLVPLGLLALLGIPFLVMLYLLKVRYRDEEVGSTFLWSQLPRDISAHQPWQKPRLSVLLLIQAALVVALALALARPFAANLAGEQQYAVLVLDGSASMLATDVAPSRFAVAVGLAREKIAALPEGSSGTLILAGPQPIILAAEANGRNLASALETARPIAGSGDVAAALRLAVALTQVRAGGQIHVISDGAFDAPTIETTSVPIELTLVGAATGSAGAQNAGNRAIVTIETRPEPRKPARSPDVRPGA